TEQWASRAELVLVGVNRQLDLLARTEQAWNASEAARIGTPPSAVRRLQQRRQLLERQRATLQAQLESYRELERSADELERAEARLAAIEKLLAEDPAGDPAWSAALAAQRDLRVRQRDGLRQQVDALRAGPDAASRTPLPDPAAEAGRTDRLSAAVLDAAAGRPAPAPTPGLHAQPPVAPVRDEEEDRPAAVVGT
ncbi:hypothetical protein ACFQH9_26680, partial [Pseudonocardia lutea]